MRCIWDPRDIKPGRIIGKPDRTERWMIGYIADRGTNRYVLVSLSDGLVTLPVPPDMLASQLTKEGELPSELLP